MPGRFPNGCVILNTFERLCADASLANPQQAARQILQIAKGHFLMGPTVGLEQSEATTFALLSQLLAQPKRKSALKPRNLP